MGNGVSKGSPLVKLCKERKEFIKATKYCSYDLVTAFVVYLESLLELGNTLNTYVEQQLVVFGDCSSSHVSEEEDCDHLEFSSSDSESDLHSLCDHLHCDEKEKPRCLFHDSPEVQDECYTCKDHCEANMDIKYDKKNSGKPRVDDISHEWSSLSSKNNHHSNHENTHIHVTMSHDEDLGHHGEHSPMMSFGKRLETPPSGHWFPQQENQEYFAAPVSFSYHNANRFVYYDNVAFSMDVPYYHVGSQIHGTEQNKPSTPPPPPEVSTWDFLYPFNMDYDVHYDYDHDLRKVRDREGIPDLEDENETEKGSAVSSVFDEKGKKIGMRHGMDYDVKHGSGHNVRKLRDRKGVPDSEDENESEKFSAVSSVFDEKGKKSGMRHGIDYDVKHDCGHNLREVRERKGASDLEDETEESSSVSSVFDEQKMEREMRHGSPGNGTSNVTQLNPNEDASSTKGQVLKIWIKTTEKEIKPNLETETREDIWSEAKETNVQGTMGLKEAVLYIRNEFKYVYECGKEFSSVIEVAKLPHHSISTKLRAFASCVLRLIIPSVQTCLLPSYMSYQPVSRARLFSNAEKKKNQELVCTSDLSSTLEKLYVWEKKLHREVIVEEKLRIPYDKQYKRLKELDGRGSEADKIDDAFASFKLTCSEMNVVVASISAISREIHDLRDNKLLPELNKIIESLIRLWKVMSRSHQKQLQDITKAKGHVHILDPKSRKRSSSKATLRLERVFLKWDMCFSNFINTQKAFLKHLNDWLMRHILQETEETGDGISPFLPSDIGAPPIFRICNDWYHAIDKLSEIGVSEAISKFATSLHQLYEKLEEEQELKVTVKYLLKDYQHKLQSFCNKNCINCHHCISFANMKAPENFDEAEVPLLSAPDENLVTSRKRLVEQRKRHQEVIKHVNDVASSCLQKGLPPIFEALGSFCLENLKIYEQLRLPNTGSHE